MKEPPGARCRVPHAPTCAVRAPNPAFGPGENPPQHAPVKFLELNAGSSCPSFAKRNAKPRSALHDASCDRGANPARYRGLRSWHTCNLRIRFSIPNSRFDGAKVFDFAAAAPARDANASEELGYALVKSGPALRADECELPDVTALEIMISWGDNVLHVAHLNPPRAFHVGDDSQGESVDFVAPVSAGRWPLVALVGGVPHAVVPSGAEAEIDLPGAPKRALDSTLAQPFAELSGAQAVPLTTGASVTIRSGALVYRVGVVAAGKPTSRRILGADRGPAAYFGMAVLAHAALAGALAFFTPALGLSSENDFDTERRYMVQQYLDAAAERERENKPEPAAPTDEPTGGGESGPEARGSSGQDRKNHGHDRQQAHRVQRPGGSRRAAARDRAAGSADDGHHRPAQHDERRPLRAARAVGPRRRARHRPDERHRRLVERLDR